MTPHFIFNVLTAIKSLVINKKPEEAGKYLAAPAAIEAAIPTAMDPVLLAANAKTTLESANIEPTDKSIPPVIMTKVMPKANTRLIEACKKTLVKFV